MSIYTELKVGDRVVKNPMTMIPNEFSLWGRGEGVGIVMESPFPMEYGSVDVRWPEGRCFESVIGLKKYDGPHNEWTAAHAIYDILTEKCGAPENDRMDFAYAQTQPDYPEEWRFSGHLGFGGKFWRNNGRRYVTYYPEDQTEQRDEMIARANDRLSTIGPVSTN